LNQTIVNYVILGFSVGVIALTLLFWPVSAILRWHYGKPLTLDPRSKRMRLILRIICAVDVVFVIAFAIAFSSLEKLGGLGPHGDFWLHLMQVIGVLGRLAHFMRFSPLWLPGATSSNG